MDLSGEDRTRLKRSRKCACTCVSADGWTSALRPWPGHNNNSSWAPTQHPLHHVCNDNTALRAAENLMPSAVHCNKSDVLAFHCTQELHELAIITGLRQKDHQKSAASITCWGIHLIYHSRQPARPSLWLHHDDIPDCMRVTIWVHRQDGSHTSHICS